MKCNALFVVLFADCTPDISSVYVDKENKKITFYSSFKEPPSVNVDREYILMYNGEFIESEQFEDWQIESPADSSMEGDDFYEVHVYDGDKDCTPNTWEAFNTLEGAIHSGEYHAKSGKYTLVTIVHETEEVWKWWKVKQKLPILYK